MLKVIRLDKKEYNGKRFNNLYKIDNELALAAGFVAFDYIPKRRILRKHIIEMHNRKYALEFPVSHKDIKRMERPYKCEIPVNIVDVLEIIITEILQYKNNFNYRAQDNYIVSLHVLTNTINALEDFCVWLDGHENGECPENDKYRKEAAYVVRRFEEFNEKYPQLFNELF